MTLSAKLERARTATVCLGFVSGPSKRLTLGGSGVVVDAERGLIATAKHVFEEMQDQAREDFTPIAVNYKRLSVLPPPADHRDQNASRLIADGRMMQLSSVWIHTGWDLALFRASLDPNEPPLTAVELAGDDELPDPEAPVAAFGYPRPNQKVVFAGALGTFGHQVGREGDVPPGMLFFRMYTAPGHSGGPLVDLKTGRLLGIVFGYNEPTPRGTLPSVGVPTPRAAPVSAVRELMARAPADSAGKEPR